MAKLSDMKIDEISLVRKGANQGSRVAIAKSAEETEGMEMEEFYDADGYLVDVDQLEDGEVVFDADGNPYEMQDESDAFDYEDELEPELEPVGKSLGASLREEFSKALTDDDRDYVIHKAFAALDEQREIAAAADDMANQERVNRVFGEYVQVAKSLALPFADEEVAETLYNVAEYLPLEDQERIAIAFELASEAALEDEMGYDGDGSSVIAGVEDYLNDAIEKGHDVDQTDIFRENPGLYEAYLAEQNYR